MIASRADHPKHGPEFMASTLPAVEADVHSSVHREKEAAVSDQLNQPIACHSLVAKPIGRKLWPTMFRTLAAVDAEWKQLRECDNGSGTWDGSQPTTE